MSPRLLIAVIGFAGVLLAGGYAWYVGLLGFEPKLVTTPEAIVLGERVFKDRCLVCHARIPLPPRVRGWSARRAYRAIGRLPTLEPAMPPFTGTDEERRALAVYLAVLGADR